MRCTTARTAVMSSRTSLVYGLESARDSGGMVVMVLPSFRMKLIGACRPLPALERPDTRTPDYVLQICPIADTRECRSDAHPRQGGHVQACLRRRLRNGDK